MANGIEELPAHGVWEVEIVDVPEVTVAGEPLRDVMVVMQLDGLVRGVTALGDGVTARSALEEACVRPAPPLAPGRPQEIHCRPAVAARIGAVARRLRARLVETETLAAAPEAVESLRRRLASPPVLVPLEGDLWRPLLEQVVEEAPWADLPDSVCIKFADGPKSLREATAMWIGQAGEQLGFVVFPTASDLEAFDDFADTHDERFATYEAWSLYLDPIAECTDDEADLARALDLVRAGLIPRVAHLHGVDMTPLSTPEQESLVAALQGALALWRAAGPSQAIRPAAVAAPTRLGPAMVLSLPVELLPEVPRTYLDHTAHQVGVRGADGPEQRPAVLLKMAKRDAERTARWLTGVDAIYLERGHGTVILGVFRGDIHVGALTSFEDMPALDSWAFGDRVQVVIAGGGAKRPTFRPEHVVATLSTTLLELE